MGWFSFVSIIACHIRTCYYGDSGVGYLVSGAWVLVCFEFELEVYSGCQSLVYQVLLRESLLMTIAILSFSFVSISEGCSKNYPM